MSPFFCALVAGAGPGYSHLQMAMERPGILEEWAALAREPSLRVAGLMSGTSADGIDVAIVDFSPRKTKLLAFAMVPYPPAVREAIFRLFRPETSRVDDICSMNFRLGELFAAAVIRTAGRAGIKLGSIDLIGSHGQTIYHIPRAIGRGRASKVASTLQIGEPSVIARRTGITTVADFRPADIAAGGQGAPLVPLADLLLFGHPTRTRVTQNIGGIANVTYLPGGGGIGDVIAFDTGPGNMIIDRLANLATGGKLAFDRGGRLGRRGKVLPDLLGQLMRHPYLRRRPPKTTGREMFGVEFADALYKQARRARLDASDLIATATAFTAASIAGAYRRFLPHMPDEVIVCGGGSRNPVLVEMLRRELLGCQVRVMDELGIDADAKEALSFALLAVRTIRGQAGNVPSATGAKGPAVLGKVVLAR